jgi:hypothetical protein
METYEEPIDDFVLGGSQRSGFIASLIAKKEAGKDFDPLANKQRRKKRGLTRFDKNKIDLVSDNIIDNVLKSKPLEKWRDKQVETYKKKKVFSPNLPYPGKQPSKEGMSKTDMLKMLTIKEIRDLVSTLRGKLHKDGKPKDKAELLKTLSNYSMDKLMTGIGAVVPPEKIEKLQGKLYPMWKNPKKPEKKEPEPEPEPEPMKQTNIRSFIKKTGKGMPPEKLFYESAKQSYEKVAPNNLNGFQKIADTPTLDAYLRPSDKTILIASRGTNLSSFNDLKADASLVANNLVNTNRYAEDKNALVKVMEQYPPEQYEYYLSGHSLAGAIITQLKRDFPFLKTAVAYNSAFQTKDLTQQPANVRRYYTDKDFLYNLGGKYFRNNIVIPADKEQAQGFFQRIKSALTPSGITGHSLSNFEKVYKGQGKPISIARNMTKRPRPFSAKEIQQVKKAREDYYKTLPPAMTLEEAQLKPLMDNPLGRFAFEVAKVGQNIVKPVIREAINLIPETKGLKELKQVAKNVIDILPEDRRLDDGRLSGLRDRAVSGVQNFSPVQKQARNLGLIGDGKAEPEDQIDFDKIQWGTFEAGMKRYKKQHPYSKVKTLEDFAKIIRKNPNKFSKAMVKKANFYLNVLKKD